MKNHFGPVQLYVYGLNLPLGNIFIEPSSVKGVVEIDYFRIYYLSWGPCITREINGYPIVSKH